MRGIFRAIILFSLSGCATNRSVDASPSPASTPIPLGSKQLLAHISVLSADGVEGRAPGTSGERQAIDYIASEFGKAGLSPLSRGEFSQKVPLRALSASGRFSLRSGSRAVTLDPAKDFIVQADRSLTLRSDEIVFAGYGIIAPEFGRDDYGSTDVVGKVVIVLAGEPAGFPSRKASKLGPQALDAIAESKRTYHQWFWMKQVNALKRGAKAVFILTADDRIAARRRYFQQDYMLPETLPPWAPPLSGFLSERIFEKGGPLDQIDLAQLRTMAVTPGFRPVALPLHLKGEVSVESRPLLSRNVVGRIEGNGPGCVVLIAHWDGYGRDPDAAGDNIWNGAVDDAGGVAQLIEIARQLAAQGRPRRSIYFVAATGEERGFLGSRQFLASSPCAPSEMAAAINLDWFYELGRTKRFASHGLGYSSLDETIERLIRGQGRTVTAANAYYAGGDQLPFMLAGVPGFHGGSVSPLVGQSDGYEEAYYAKLDANAVKKEGNSNEDEVQPQWDLRGAVEDAEIIWQLAGQIANAPAVPCWKVPSQFEDPKRICR